MALQFNIDEVFAKEIATDLPKDFGRRYLPRILRTATSEVGLQRGADRKLNVINGLRDFGL